MIDLTHIESLAREATPGPYYAVAQMNRQGEILGWLVNHPNGRIGWLHYATLVPNEGESSPYPTSGANARFIAAVSPDVVLELVEMARRGGAE